MKAKQQTPAPRGLGTIGTNGTNGTIGARTPEPARQQPGIASNGGGRPFAFANA